MKITPIEIEGYALRKKAFGYDPREVESLKERAASALEESNRERTRLEEKVRELEGRLSEHLANETLLKEAITTTQKMTMDIKENAKKEAELIIAESQVRGDDIIRQAQTRAGDISDEILHLKKQRAEFEASLKALLYYHTTLRLRIQPGSSKKSICGLHGEALKVKLFAPPVEGAANKALIAFLSKALGIKKSAISLTSGERSKDKRVFIEGVMLEEMEEIFLKRFKDIL